MTNEQQIRSIPESLKLIIQYQNTKLADMKQMLLTELYRVNNETMELLGLDPNDGWRLDLTNEVYVRVEESPDTELDIDDSSSVN